MTSMTLFPYSRLFLGQSRTILTSGPHIQSVHTLYVFLHFLPFVFNNSAIRTGEIKQSTASLPLQEKEAVLKSGPIRCTALDITQKYLATSGDDKMLKLWDVDTLKLLSERCAASSMPLGHANDDQCRTTESYRKSQLRFDSRGIVKPS